MSDTTEKILQIMPADGWVASFEDEDALPLVCFALMQGVDGEGNAFTAVRPMACVDDEIVYCDDFPNYLGVERADAGEEEYDEEEEEEE